jgi:hypothetical protein
MKIEINMDNSQVNEILSSCSPHLSSQTTVPEQKMIFVYELPDGKETTDSKNKNILKDDEGKKKKVYVDHAEGATDKDGKVKQVPKRVKGKTEDGKPDMKNKKTLENDFSKLKDQQQKALLGAIETILKDYCNPNYLIGEVDVKFTTAKQLEK